MTARVRPAEALYVGAVMALSAVSLVEPHRPKAPLLVAAVLLALPAVVLLSPVLYVLAAVAWSVAGSDAGEPSWPVTGAYAVLLGVAAVANVALRRIVVRSRQRERIRWADLPPPPRPASPPPAPGA